MSQKWDFSSGNLVPEVKLEIPVEIPVLYCFSSVLEKRFLSQKSHKMTALETVILFN